ncbi:MAG: hypothetical protein V4505_25640 [Pseudomonadota bacterium]
MDTPSSESSAAESSTAPLTTDQAGSAFAALFQPPEKKEAEADPDAPALEEVPADPDAEPLEADAAAQADATVTVEVDGKPVELTHAQIAELHKGGLRQEDYTRKTMAAADAKKAADAEVVKTRAERQQYAANLNRMEAQLEGALQQQQSIDWDKLISEDPVEAMRQKHLYDQRQAALAQTRQEKAGIESQTKAEQAANFERHLATQRELLHAKLPEWKDAKRATAEQGAMTDYLVKTMGFTPQEVFGEKDAQGNLIRPGIADHRAMLLAHKAMKYDEIVGKAAAAAKKLTGLPSKTERPGVAATTSQALDKRTAAQQRLAKSGSVEDAGRVFSSMFSS